ncbi:MAG: hypothetical protein CR994_02650 [Maribacter sp.]|nr:MAG: hypothetical protein CR994_02650 [Maribacter sp.]
MKKIILTLFFVATTSLVLGQRVMEGESQINAGFGFTSDWGVPFYGGFDYGVHEDITVGLQVSYASETYNAGSYGDYKGTWFGVGANGNYHFNTVLDIPDNFDVYAGVTLAYDSFSYKYPNGFIGSNTSSGMGFAGQIGARYYFSDKLGVNLEFGGGNITSGGKIGISYKL